MRPLSMIKIAMFVILILGAACGDDPDAQFNRGLQYHKKQNYLEAVKWFEKAAEQGHTDALSKLDTLYYDIGLQYHKKQNYLEAAKWFVKATEQGHTDALSKLQTYIHDGLLGERNIKKENRIMLLEAQKDSAVAQYVSGEEIMYKAQRYEEAYYWLSLAKKKRNIFLEQHGVSIDSLNTRLDELERLIDDPKKINDLQKLTGDDWKPKQLSGGGSGFYIKRDLILTNEHVIRKCDEVYIERNYRPYRVDVRFRDTDVDLALLEISFPIEFPLGEDLRNDPKALALAERLAEATHNYFLPSASFRSESDSLHLGEDIAVFGYPLPETLSYNGNFTTGIISSIEGPPNSFRPSNSFQFTAPIQPGNSGGPVLDAAGNVVGVIKAYLSDSQNVNFAVSLKAIRKFLRDAEEEPGYVSSSDTRKEWTEIARAAKEFTVPVLCFTDKP